MSEENRVFIQARNVRFLEWVPKIDADGVVPSVSLCAVCEWEGLHQVKSLSCQHVSWLQLFGVTPCQTVCTASICQF